MVIGITGGVGTGKSSILNILKTEYSAWIIMADEVGRALQAPDGSCYGPITEEFGEEILDKNAPGQPIDRPKLAAIVFGDPEKMARLNSIVHPFVRAAIASEIGEIYQKDRNALICVEAALLIESGYLDMLDELWVVTAEREIRIRRLEESRGYTREKCEQVMASQLSPEEYAGYADFIIDNSKSLKETKAQIRSRLEMLRP